MSDKEIYTFFENIVLVLKIISPVDDEKGEGRVETGRTWDIFEGGEEREGKEEVWCGVYFKLRNEVWVGTSDGWVWRKGIQLEKKKIPVEVGVGIRAMAIVGSQVKIFIFLFSFIVRLQIWMFFFFGFWPLFGPIRDLNKHHTKTYENSLLLLALSP